MSDEDAYAYCLSAAETALQRYNQTHDPLQAGIHDYWQHIVHYLRRNPPRRDTLVPSTNPDVNSLRTRA